MGKVPNQENYSSPTKIIDVYLFTYWPIIELYLIVHRYIYKTHEKKSSRIMAIFWKGLEIAEGIHILLKTFMNIFYIN